MEMKTMAEKEGGRRAVVKHIWVSCYEKPLFEKADGMDFPTKILAKNNEGRFCTHCSSCHGCS